MQQLHARPKIISNNLVAVDMIKQRPIRAGPAQISSLIQKSVMQRAIADLNEKVNDLQATIEQKTNQIQSLEKILGQNTDLATKIAAHSERIESLLQLEENRRQEMVVRTQQIRFEYGAHVFNMEKKTTRFQEGHKYTETRIKRDKLKAYIGLLASVADDIRERRKDIGYDAPLTHNLPRDLDIYNQIQNKTASEALPTIEGVVRVRIAECKELNQKLEGFMRMIISNDRDFRLLSEETTCYWGSMSKSTNALSFPRLIYRYQVLRFLGKGAYGQVYKCFDLHEGKFVAIKIVPSKIVSDEGCQRVERQFEHEVAVSNLLTQLHQGLDHHNILKFHRVEKVESRLKAMVLEFVEGGDLATYLKSKGPLDENEAFAYVFQILSALNHMHTRPDGAVIHRDLKPGNLLLDRGIVKIADFGLATKLAAGECKEAMRQMGVGTIGYIPPESRYAFHPSRPQYISAKYDIYAVGRIFCTMLFGKNDVGDGNSERPIELPKKPVVTNKARRLIEGCLAFDQEKRLTAQEAIELLLRREEGQEESDIDEIFFN